VACLPDLYTTTRFGSAAPAGCRSSLSNAIYNEYKEANSMIKDEGKSVSDNKSKQATHRVRLPGFIIDEEIGLGDPSNAPPILG
jgi:hypothetical protein